MINKYNNYSLAELESKWDEKRRIIAELPPSDRLPCDMEELLSMRKEIERRRGSKPPVVDVNFTDKYLTD